MSNKKNVLFVDDEQNVLDGLRRMLRSMRSEWDMAFAPSGDQALEILETKQFDVIISDMRMPGMSGEQLLTEVRTRHPGIVRLVLSGQADKKSILKSVGPIHQFLQKPCDEETLKSTICRTIELGDLFADDDLKSMVTELESLPSLPSHQQELIAQFEMSDVSAKVIGESIGRDMAMTVKILQLVNSAFFGLRRHVANPADAVVLLGMDTVRSLVMTLQVFSLVSDDTVKGFSQEGLLSHSAEVATIAKKIAQAEDMEPTDVENAYLAGLLHDIGKLVLAAKRPLEFAEALALARSQELSSEESERQIIGASHSEIGAYLLGLWAFDIPIVDAALYHHSPGTHRSSRFSISTAVHVADAIARHDPAADNATELDIDHEYLNRIGVADRLAFWQDTYPCAA